MKLKIGQLLGWVLIFEIVNDPLRRLVETLDFNKSILHYFTNPLELIFFLSFFLSFGLMSVLVHVVFSKTYPKRKTLKTFLGVLLSIVVAIGFRYFLEEKIIYWIWGYRNYKGDYDWSYYFFDNLYFAMLYVAIGIIFFFFQYSKYAERQKKILELENKKSELAFLKSQVNPHFLFNSLNNLYYLIYDKSDNALKSVEKLANLLRYSLYENEHKVALSKEVEAINNFVELEQLRHDYDLSLDMRIDESINHIEIPPFIFVPFVENVFKHGSLNDQDNPALIHLDKMNQDIVFVVHNKKQEKEKDVVGGVGLENVRRRLELIYGENYYLDVENTADTFTVKLKLLNIC